MFEWCRKMGGCFVSSFVLVNCGGCCCVCLGWFVVVGGGGVLGVCVGGFLWGRGGKFVYLRFFQSVSKFPALKKKGGSEVYVTGSVEGPGAVRRDWGQCEGTGGCVGGRGWVGGDGGPCGWTRGHWEHRAAT